MNPAEEVHGPARHPVRHAVDGVAQHPRPELEVELRKQSVFDYLTI